LRKELDDILDKADLAIEWPDIKRGLDRLLEARLIHKDKDWLIRTYDEQDSSIVTAIQCPVLEDLLRPWHGVATIGRFLRAAKQPGAHLYSGCSPQYIFALFPMETPCPSFEERDEVALLAGSHSPAGFTHDGHKLV
jgi:hypothetical protein